MTNVLIAAVHIAACKLDCLVSLALAITDTLDRSAEMADPAESARQAADLARIAVDELRLVAGDLIEAEDAAALFITAAMEPPPIRVI
jgi:hypothetical protein